jgi:outer membrane immunogenic protein
MSKKTVAATLLFASAAAQGLVNPAASGVLAPPPAYPVAYPPHPAILDPAPAYAPAPVYDWSGLYVGINGGASSGRASWVSDPDLTAGADTHSSGLVGGTIGYNSQTFGHLVVGEEFDFNWRRFSFNIPAATCGPACTLDSNWFSTARLRFGYQIDRFLPYVTGGLSIGDFDAHSIGQPNGINRSVSFNFAAGAGVEVGVIGPWSGKLEYLYVNHSRIDCIVECNGPVHIQPSENILRVGLNYRIWQR